MIRSHPLIYLDRRSSRRVVLSGAGALMFCTALASAQPQFEQLWIRQLGTSTLDEAIAASSDGAGGLYVGGYTMGALGGPNRGGGDIWFARYDAQGNRAWICHDGTSSEEGLYAAAPDGAGGVYISGGTEGSFGGPNAGAYDVYLARYDGAGNRVWITQFGTSSHDVAFGAAPDGAGGVFVTGYTEGSLDGPNAGLSDAWVARDDGVGNLVWITQFGTSSQDKAQGVAPDGAGGVFVTGYTEGSLHGLNAGRRDAWLARYDGAGNRLWITQFGTSSQDFGFRRRARWRGRRRIRRRFDCGKPLRSKRGQCRHLRRPV